MPNITNQFELITFAKKIVNIALTQFNIDLRLFGSIAVDINCCLTSNVTLKSNNFKDIDFVAKNNQISEVNKFFSIIRFQHVENTFSKFGSHYVFKGDAKDFGCNILLDVYFGTLSFNHTIPGPYFDKINKFTIPITQLFLSKLAIVELVTKDKLDLLALLQSCNIDNKDDCNTINAKILTDVWCNGVEGWGLFTTCSKNLELLRNCEQLTFLDALSCEKVINKIDKMNLLKENCSKSFLWKLRNIFGESIKHYTFA